MISTKCIEKFPDDKCPCFIIYKGGKPVSNIVNVDIQIDKNIKNLPNFLRFQGVNIE
jgi:5'(3')-deoxyribonucleotidase